MVALFAFLGAGVFAGTNPNAPGSTKQAVRRVADRLVDEQLPNGAWPAKGGVLSGGFTGTMAAGLADAYWMTCDPDYKSAAEAAGQWIWNNAPGCNLYYDEAHAFVKLSQINCDPSDNQWRTALEDFYACIESQDPDPLYGNLAGTELYIAMIENWLSPVFATFEVAHYTVAAYYIDTPDKAIWRARLIDMLEASNVDSGEQVFALGAATWALALTGDLDSTAVYVGSSTWSGFPGGAATELEQLPDLLASYQVPSTYLTHGKHFYSVYDPPSLDWSGWTETNVFAVMGLDAADNGSSYDFRSIIDSAWAVNMQPVDQYGHVWYDAIEVPGIGDNATFYHYAGEYLQYLSAAHLPGDINLDDMVDMDDLAFMANNWLQLSGCNCSVADLNHDHKVNLFDYAQLAEGWLLSR